MRFSELLTILDGDWPGDSDFRHRSAFSVYDQSIWPSNRPIATACRCCAGGPPATGSACPGATRDFGPARWLLRLAISFCNFERPAGGHSRDLLVHNRSLAFGGCDADRDDLHYLHAFADHLPAYLLAGHKPLAGGVETGRCALVSISQTLPDCLE